MVTTRPGFMFDSTPAREYEGLMPSDHQIVIPFKDGYAMRSMRSFHRRHRRRIVVSFDCVTFEQNNHFARDEVQAAFYSRFRVVAVVGPLSYLPCEAPWANLYEQFLEQQTGQQ